MKAMLVDENKNLVWSEVEKPVVKEDEVLVKHAEWAEKWMAENDVTAENIHGIVQNEIGKVFAKVLECAGVYKRTEDGQKYFYRFMESVGAKRK